MINHRLIIISSDESQDILDSGTSHRRRRNNFLVYVITQKMDQYFFHTWHTCKGWPKEDLYFKMTLNSQ